MRTATRSPRWSRPGRWLAAATLMGLTALSGCGASPYLEPVEQDTSSPAAAVRVPEDGARLAAFGFQNGPIEQFSLPRNAALTAMVDQPNNVTAVITAPAATEVYGYLLRALPQGGFTVSAQDVAATTLTFAGHGWVGSFTGDARTAAVLLRPA